MLQNESQPIKVGFFVGRMNPYKSFLVVSK